jgi:hypothetical protein
MREYGQVQVAFWTHPDIQGLSDQAKLLALYLLTCSHSNSLGCYRLPEGYITEDLKWGSETVSKRFRELENNRFAFRDKNTGWVFMPNFLRWNTPQNPNVAKGIEKIFDSVPTNFKQYRNLLETVLKFGNRLSEPFRNRLETVLESFRNKEPEPEPEPKEYVGFPSDVSPPQIKEHGNGFDIFWQEYPPRGDPPSRENRKGAFATWTKLSKGKLMPDVEVVIDCLSRCKGKWDNPKYIPMASTWLNREPWKDGQGVSDPPKHDPPKPWLPDVSKAYADD